MIKGYIATRTFKGTCTSELFEEFIIKQVLPKYTLYPGPWSVIIINNASVYYSHLERIKEVTRHHGVWVHFLPLYSPDFNLIKESFSDLKAYIRCYYHQEISKFDDYQSFLEWVVRKVSTRVEAR